MIYQNPMDIYMSNLLEFASEETIVRVRFGAYNIFNLFFIIL